MYFISSIQNIQSGVRTNDFNVHAYFEAVYRFETPFKVTIEQAGEVVMEAVYGRRTNLKVKTPNCRLLSSKKLKNILQELI